MYADLTMSMIKTNLRSQMAPHMASYPLDSGSVGGRYRRPGLPSAVPGSVTIRRRIRADPSTDPGIRRRIVTSVDESVILGRIRRRITIFTTAGKCIRRELVRTRRRRYLPPTEPESSG